MAKISVKQASTSVTVNIFIQDSSSTTGAGLTGLVFNSSGLTAYYMRPKIAATVITLATLAAVTSAYSSGGFKEIDATNAPGWYRFDVPDAALANAERFVSIHLKGATNMAPLPLEIELTGFDNQSTTDGSLSKLTSLTFTGANKVDASVRDWLGTAVTAATAGIPDVNTKNINNVAAATPGASGGLLISGTNSGTTTFGALTVTAALTVSGGVSVTQSTTNGHGLSITGNGTGHGIVSTSGSGATGDGIKAVAASTNGNGATLAKTGSGNDLNATSTPLTLAKTTNITGFNDITAAAAATGVWQDTTAGDFTVASSIGKSLFTSGNAPGAASGLALVGSNMGTVSSVTGAVGSVTGAVGSVTAGVTLAAGAVDSVALATSGINAIWGAATRNLTGSQGIKKNTAKAGFLFAMTDSTNHNPVTGLTVTAQRSLDGAAFAGCTNSVVEVSAGWYKIDLAAGDLNGDTVALKFTGTSADQLNISLVTSS